MIRSRKAIQRKEPFQATGASTCNEKLNVQQQQLQQQQHQHQQQQQQQQHQQQQKQQQQQHHLNVCHSKYNENETNYHEKCSCENGSTCTSCPILPIYTHRKRIKRIKKYSHKRSRKMMKMIRLSLIVVFVFILASTSLYTIIYNYYQSYSIVSSIIHSTTFWHPDNTKPITSMTTATAETSITTPATTWPEPILHIINTRFNQNQGNLTTLARARLHLFETFCLPSMIQQSTQNFIWIIKIDPGLDEKIKHELISLVTVTNENDVNSTNSIGTTETMTEKVTEKVIENNFDQGNIYVVGSNQNYLTGETSNPGSWKDGNESQHLIKLLHENQIYTGNKELLQLAILSANRNERIILETRLDADDGLHQYYIEYIQKDALKRFHPWNDSVKSSSSSSSGSNIRNDQPTTDNMDQHMELNPASSSSSSPLPPPIPPPTPAATWYFWCIEKHIKWYINYEIDVGSVSAEIRDKYCITPGLTIGFNRNTNVEDVPMKYPHHKLYSYLTSTSNQQQSIQQHHQQQHLVDDGRNDHVVNVHTDVGAANDKVYNCNSKHCLAFVSNFVGAVRSRTATSAGMEDTEFNSILDVGKDGTNIIWNKLKIEFNVSKDSVRSTQTFFQTFAKDIARENLEGQCTNGHSCKKSSEHKLKKLIDGDG